MLFLSNISNSDAYSVASPLLSHIVEGARSMGYDVNRILSDNNISPAILTMKNTRVPLELVAQLNLYLINLLGDEYFGLCDTPMRLKTFKHACYSAIHGDNIGEVLNLFAEFSNIATSAFIHEVIVSDQQAKFILRKRPSTSVRTNYLYEHIFLSVHRVLCWMSDQRIPIIRIDLDYPPSDYYEEYPRLFYGAPVNFNQHASALVINKNDLNLKVVKNIRSLKEIVRDTPMNLFFYSVNPTNLSGQLRNWLQGTIIKSRKTPTIEEAASEFGIHPKTLRKRLKQENSAYISIKSDVRKDLAHNLIDNPELTIEKISEMLGFSEPSAFIKAFKGWYQKTPLQYRKSVRK